MAELRVEAPSVICVLASAEICDALERTTSGSLARVADREVLLVGDRDVATTREEVDDPHAVVEDVSDGWTCLALEGDDGIEAFARLTELRLPASGWVQGEVARAPAKVLVEPGRLSIFVPAHLAAHVEERVRVDAAEVLAS